LLRALRSALERPAGDPRAAEFLPSAWFQGASGREPVTLNPPPPSLDRLSARTREALQEFLQKYAELGHERDLTVRLAYVPSKETVLCDQLTPTPDAPEGWNTTSRSDLCADLARRCTDAGIRFLDLTPALRAETIRARELLFNGLYDTHLNQRGSEVVAGELAGWLTAPGP
jgi:hypothetical protein